ncbi:methyltransferase domain-containing protein [bacterium]|nr:methyltransferase domain-containing protein [bacterium]
MSNDKITILIERFNVDANELFINKEKPAEEKQVITTIYDYYNQYDEDSRLKRRTGQVEYLTTSKYIHEYLKPGDKIIEIGAGTGAYSISLAEEGYDVTSIELVKHNLDILKSKITNDMNIKTYQGNALDLSMFPSESFDITLVLGPMYHLFTKEDKVKCLLEAKRITKKEGYIFVAYCMNEATIITYVFESNGLTEVIDKNLLTRDWHCKSDPKEIFELVRIEDINEYNKESDLKRIKIVATDGASRYIRDHLNKMSDEVFSKWIDFHLHTCERIDLIGATHHSLDILKKNNI